MLSNPLCRVRLFWVDQGLSHAPLPKDQQKTAAKPASASVTKAKLSVAKNAGASQAQAVVAEAAKDTTPSSDERDASSAREGAMVMPHQEIETWQEGVERPEASRADVGR